MDVDLDTPFACGSRKIINPLLSFLKELKWLRARQRISKRILSAGLGKDGTSSYSSSDSYSDSAFACWLIKRLRLARETAKNFLAMPRACWLCRAITIPGSLLRFARRSTRFFFFAAAAVLPDFLDAVCRR